MPFDWGEYLRIAEFLQLQSGHGFTQEGAFRCAVSRSYYAVYCSARNHARDHNNFRPTGLPQDHVNLQKHLQGQGKTGIARKLDDLRRWRNTCDYDDSVDETQHDLSTMATLAIWTAGHVLRKLA